jgi:hypothetical protein
MPKPFVHLMGPPLDVALDARVVGDEGRFARNGCRPNAVLRPLLCPKAKDGSKAKESSEKEGTESAREERWESGKRKNDKIDSDDETLTFGVFALRDLKANEEVVLGWEWDDGNAVHSLPALIESPHLFSCVFLSPVPLFNPHFLFLSNRFWTVYRSVRSLFSSSSIPLPSHSLSSSYIPY